MMMNRYKNDLQGVLSYEERLQRAREELRRERAEQRATLSDLQYWRTRAKELEAKLKMYEREKVEDKAEICTTDHALGDEDRHESPLRRGSEAAVGVEGHGTEDGAHEPSHGIPVGMEELDMMDAETVDKTTVSGDAGAWGKDEDGDVTAADDGGEKCDPLTDMTWGHSVGPADEVDGSVEQPVGTEVQVNAAESAAVPPAAGGEMSNASAGIMCWVEECGVYVLRQDMGAVDNFDSHGMLQFQSTPDKGVIKSADREEDSQPKGKSSSNIVKRMKMRPRTRRPAAVRGSPYRQSIWRCYRHGRKKSDSGKVGREGASEVRHAPSDADVAARAAGVQLTVVGPIPTALQPDISNVMLSDQVLKLNALPTVPL